MHVDREIGAGRRRLELVENRIDVAGHLARGLVSIRRILLQSLRSNAIDLRRHFFIEFRRRLDARLANLLEDGDLVFAGEQFAIGQHLEQHRRQSEDVRSAIDWATPRLFRRHVLQLSLQRAGPCV